LGFGDWALGIGRHCESKRPSSHVPKVTAVI
jgi:hypothetical protein